MPYKNLEINPAKYNPQHTDRVSQIYKGFSTVDPTNYGSKLYDFDLIKQDLINQFYTRRGQRVMNPMFGTIIWDLLMEPLTEQVKEALTNDITRICNADPRVYPIQIKINEEERGYFVEITLAMKNTDQRTTLRLSFDQQIGLRAE
jgi:phage baseplate assembly protein W